MRQGDDGADNQDEEEKDWSSCSGVLWGKHKFFNTPMGEIVAVIVVVVGVMVKVDFLWFAAASFVDNDNNDDDGDGCDSLGGV